MRTDEETCGKMKRRMLEENPSVAYHTALKVEMESQLEGDNGHVDDEPALVEAQPLLPFIEEELDVDQPLEIGIDPRMDPLREIFQW